MAINGTLGPSAAADIASTIIYIRFQKICTRKIYMLSTIPKALGNSKRVTETELETIMV